jgi:hypothetical protein
MEVIQTLQFAQGIAGKILLAKDFAAKPSVARSCATVDTTRASGWFA